MILSKFNPFRGSLLHIRRASSWQSTGLRYKEFGDPDKVLAIETESIPQTLSEGDVALKFLAAPINPADINTVQGVYGVKPKLPWVAGNEGTAEVLSVGSAVKNVKCGDRVIMSTDTPGTWQTHAVVPATQVLKIPNDVPFWAAATLAINPCTAFRMLYDYAALRKGDVIIQNGANSAVGQLVIQFAAANDWQTINIIRDRPDKEATLSHLKSLGGTHNITDADLQDRKLLGSLPKAKLGLNCVGGKAVSDMTKLLTNQAQLVTYGGMSKQPLLVPTTALIFKDIVLRGFWIGAWCRDSSTEERIEMLNNVVQLMKDAKVRPPKMEAIGMKDYKEAIKKTQEGFCGKKYLLVLDEQIMDQVRKELQ
ncbi:enoyl-[acyl-carrier-protein] reductase, mitochondrial-like [Paramacrobiotus metropolitanus]|uniref:enoyl-[acyl-carrier-protein] reductase, mitochondrial-like n=1 Tax=Paramacrobiotus metropolitanus TaxID=2943436 RepID=UPI002445FE53|nr:enoyl-[acyl-carrier-protein] reductase, mitochondrial-like [Paramacrobiotus metropolitanus]